MSASTESLTTVLQVKSLMKRWEKVDVWTLQRALYASEVPNSPVWLYNPTTQGEALKQLYAAAYNLASILPGGVTTVRGEGIPEDACGSYQLSTGQIYINPRMKDTPVGLRALLHEHGHRLDHEAGYLCPYTYATNRNEAIADMVACLTAECFGFLFHEPVAMYMVGAARMDNAKMKDFPVEYVEELSRKLRQQLVNPPAPLFRWND